MDIVTHAATGVLLSTAFEEPAAKVACIIGSIIPDVALAPVYYHIYQKRHTGLSLSSLGHPDKSLSEKALIPYRFAHSLLPVGILLILGFGIHNPLLIAFGSGYLFHILWDIPTHTNQFASRPFYPLSPFVLEGFGDWWRSRTGMGVMIGTWLSLGSMFFLVT